MDLLIAFLVFLLSIISMLFTVMTRNAREKINIVSFGRKMTREEVNEAGKPYYAVLKKNKLVIILNILQKVLLSVASILLVSSMIFVFISNLNDISSTLLIISIILFEIYITLYLIIYNSFLNKKLAEINSNINKKEVFRKLYSKYLLLVFITSQLILLTLFGIHYLFYLLQK